MNNYSFKSRYLRVMLLSLLFLLTAGQLNAKTIYFKNTDNWGNPKAYIWQDTNDSNRNANWPGEAMTFVGDGWYSISFENAVFNKIIFSNDGNNKTKDLDIPTDSKILYDSDWKNVQLKHPWNGGDWTWKDLEKVSDNIYSVEAEYGGAGCNWISDHLYISSPTLIGNPAKGDLCTFTFNSSDNSITITKNAPVVTQVETPTFTPAGGTYDAAQSVTIACATDGATIYYTTDGSNPTTSSTQYSGAIAVNATTTLKAIAAKDGMDNSEVAEATYTINIPTPTAPVVKIHGGLAIGNSAWDGSGRELTGNDGVYEYTFTKRSDNWNNYFFVTIDGKRIQETNESNNKKVVLNTTYTWKESTGNSAQFYFEDGILTNGNSYTVVINTNDKTIRINGNTAPVVDPKTGNLFINIANGGYTAMTKNAEGNFTWTGNINNDQVIKFSSNGTDAPEYHLASSGSNNYWVQENYLTDINPKFGAGSDYLMKYGSGDYIVTVNGDYSKVSFAKVEAPMTITKVAIFGGLTGSSWSTSETELTEVSEGVYTYQFTAPEGSNKHWAYKVYTTQGDKYFAPNGQAITVELNSETGTDGSLMDNRGNNSYKCEDIHGGGKYLVTMKLNADGTGKVTIKRIGGITANDIPVYPRGVQSETELAAYDFASNNVVYLLAEVLNHERISPEWQMTKGADGKYHLDGFAMRTTNCHTQKGDKTEEKTVFVRKFTAIDSHEDVGGTTVNLGDVHLSEGKLYNAVFDAQSNVLTLTEDESANGRMPFISLVGNEMKQDQNYDTPRGKKSDHGWQEAWLQYDENGKLLKDRRGNVMYSTMWPPKNPIYFTANIGGERLYSSEQMAFKAQNNYVAKKGSVWKTELQAAENGEAYNHLDTGDFKLEDDVEYVRYVVPDIWYVGAAKIWTGWTGRTNEHGDAQWSNHRNWGYGNKELGSGDAGTPVEAEMPYYLSTEKDYNGNFYFEKPTYFKTIEFFYNTSDYNKSRLYTTLAFGNAQIEAQSHNNGSTYDYGQYKPSVKPGEGVSVSSYIIRCYDAATGKLVTLNNGIVAQGEGNPSTTAFQDAQAGLAEGKYYFEMEVVFNIEGTDKQRTTTVKSNPFVVHFPGVYTVEPVAQQLAQMGTNPNGYVSYSTGNEAIYHVNLNAAGEIESMAVVSESERAELYNNYFGKNQGINWSDKVLVVAPVPAQFKRDAEKADATVSIERISNYTVTDNGAQKTATKRADGSMALLSSVKNFDSKAFNAVMNYVETVEGSDYNKESKGKATSVEMMRPNPKAEVAGVTVEKVANTAPITVDGREVAANYYKVNVDLNFGNANVTANSEQPAFEVFNGTTSKLYTAEAGKSYFTLSYAAVDPTEFNAANIEVVARYKDKNGNYSLAANIGDPVVANELVKGFEKKAVTTISSFELANVKVKNEDGNHNMYVTQLATETTHNDQINGYNLDAEQYKMRYEFNNADSNLEMDRFFNTEDLDVNVDVSQIFDPENAIFVTKFVGGYLPSQATIYLAPVYPVLVDGRMTVQNLVDVTNGIAGAPALKANSERYIALYGNEAEKSIVKDTGIVTGIDGISASKAVSSVRFVNVAGQMSDKPFEGMNIMVTTYTDGTTSTAKVIK